MADIASAALSNALGSKQQLSIQALKKTLESERAVIPLIQQAAESGEQALRASGRGSAVNLLV